MDVFDKRKRSEVMALIRSKNTRPEWVVRRHLHARGLRYRLHDRRLPGVPDVVLPRWRAVVFVHGCFWHGHGCRKAALPKTRTDFWREKIEGNRVRDVKHAAALAGLGWRVFIVWECELSRERLEVLVGEIVGRAGADAGDAA